MIWFVWLAYSPVGRFYQRLRIDRDVQRRTEASALSKSMDVLTPVFLGIAFVDPSPHIDNYPKMFQAFMIFIWIAFAVWWQRMPVALFGVSKDGSKEYGVMAASLGFYYVFTVLLVYGMLAWFIRFPPHLFWPLPSRQLAVVLFVDLLAQAFLTFRFYQVAVTKGVRLGP
jgi:hypothetical protein